MEENKEHFQHIIFLFYFKKGKNTGGVTGIGAENEIDEPNSN